MTAAQALQLAATLLDRAREANEAAVHDVALALAVEANGWALVAQAIEAGVPPPDTTQTSQAADTGTG